MHLGSQSPLHCKNWNRLLTKNQYYNETARIFYAWFFVFSLKALLITQSPNLHFLLPFAARGMKLETRWNLRWTRCPDTPVIFPDGVPRCLPDISARPNVPILHYGCRRIYKSVVGSKKFRNWCPWLNGQIVGLISPNSGKNIDASLSLFGKHLAKCSVSKLSIELLSKILSQTP